MSDDVDLLLSRPLDEPVDTAFSSRVIARIDKETARNEALLTAALVGAAGVGLALLPLTGAGQAVAQNLSQLAYSIPFACGIGLLLLPQILLRTVRE